MPTPWNMKKKKKTKIKACKREEWIRKITFGLVDIKEGVVGNGI